MCPFLALITEILMCAKLFQSCLTLCDPVDCGLPGSSVHVISQARILKWVATSSSRGSSQPRDQTHISCGLRKPLYAEYLMRNARLDKLQAGIKIAGRKNNNNNNKDCREKHHTLRYADDTTLMKEYEEELKRLLMRVKEESEKADLKLNV